MKRSININLLFLLLVTGLIWTSIANAVPSFARKYNMNCSGCHTAYPQLNSVGRKFKEAGYRFSTDNEKGLNQEISDFLQLEKHAPVSGVLVSRPYDKKDSGDTKVRAIHEVEIMVAGNIAKNWSGFFEMEAEDETGFEAEIGSAVLSYNYNEALNFQAGWSPIFWADGYGILSPGLRMTRGNVGAIDQNFGGADSGKLRDVRQNIGVFGRFADRIFYNANWSGDAKDAEGENASTVSGLVNVDITDNIMLGAFGVTGENENTGLEKLDYSRAGVQFQADVADARIQALYISAKDDRTVFNGGGNEKNTAYSIQGFWTFIDDSLRPTWVPLIRYDRYEQNDGRDDFSSLTLNLTHYFTQNIKGYVEYWDRFDAPTSAQEDDRLTLQFVAGF